MGLFDDLMTGLLIVGMAVAWVCLRPRDAAAVTLVLAVDLAFILAGCGIGGGGIPRDPAGCPAAVTALVRTAPSTASAPATGAWLGRLDRLRGMAKAAGGATGSQLARRELAGDLLAVVHMFSCRLSGLRRCEKTLRNGLAAW